MSVEKAVDYRRKGHRSPNQYVEYEEILDYRRKIGEEVSEHGLYMKLSVSAVITH